MRGVVDSTSDRSAPINASNSLTASFPGSLTTEIDQSVRAQAPSVPQPEGVPDAGCELCTLQVRSDQVFGPAELWDEDEFDLSDSPHLADMLPDQGQPSSEQADLYKDVLRAGVTAARHSSTQ